ncbi:hypothetical protein PPYR_08322 [Photinus pyralis]|uniref:PH domain-containing protein n=1 Tax=Photinus pyralis TaxID=7054 RepID=A0A5N4AJE4_PHOPY|nr:uncharacterized protein LOC116170534 isoform X1 [Photinus pyralis]KAB0797328.1 hypothetical protein PPYR_08322 [Photinus pyralis]
MDCDQAADLPHSQVEDFIKQKSTFDLCKQDNPMISSMVSLASSLTSPVDSGVQLLDSESEITSLMSMSGFVCDSDTGINMDEENEKQKHAKTIKKENLDLEQEAPKARPVFMTMSDIDNHNVSESDTSPAVLPIGFAANPHQINLYSDSKSSPKYSKPLQRVLRPQSETVDDVFELEPIINDKQENCKLENDDLMNVSLNSYELLDYTSQNAKSDNEMHVSMSEEVNESLKVERQEHNLEISVENPLPDDQIVYRRQRRKKSKSDTPKKRVSFHEDILNSTKIDDIHINHGFITHEFDMSMSFFERGFTRKPDVVKGRYSWAAEGDTPYYHSNVPEREVKSDIYIHHARFSSSSSSSSASISSSIDEEDTGYSNSTSDDGNVKRDPPTQKLPKSSCLKKTKAKHIDTNIVQEEVTLRKKKSETNLLDSNIFGSLKNMFSFSTSVPLAERGVPEGQEDVSIYSTSDIPSQRQRKYSSSEHSTKSFDGYEVQPAPVKKIGNLNLEFAKTNLKLTKSEGFYPNYPSNQTLSSNIIICDSNVYEHKGISYSYEYEKFQKTFEQQTKPKSSTVYQMLLNELNFFKRREKKAIEKEAKENFDVLNASTPIKEEILEDKPVNSNLGSIKKYASSATIDFSDSDTTWDYNESGHTRHLNSPKKKANKGYSSHSLKADTSDDRSDIDVSVSKSLQNMRPSSSKSSLINRFLRNVTMKKVMDLKLQRKQKSSRNYFKLYVPGAKANPIGSKQLDLQIEKEIIAGRKKNISRGENDTYLYRFKNEIFRNYSEELIKVFPVYSAYTTSGENKPLIAILSSTTLYITGVKHNNSYCNFFVLPYTELNTILIGPNAQTIHLSNYDNDMQCIVTTGSETLTNELIGQLEMAMRKDINKPRLPAVKQLSMRDMVNLRRSICRQTTVLEEEEYFHYSIINIQDYNVDICETPLGPTKEGPLMFKMAESDTRWETAYFILKAGILYMLSSPSHRLPMRVLPLINGACQGAWRIYNCSRPHTFQVQVGLTTLHLAAPDEYVASEWLQALVHAASKTYNHREKLPAQSCSLLMTSDHILSVREAFPCTLNSSLSLRDAHIPIKGAQALSCAAIADITAFRLPCAEQSWCILEFSCREVHESSGDWILYFTTNTELEKFISTLEMLWAYHNDKGESFPLSTIPETDPINRKCVDTYNMIKNTWLSLQINLQPFED